MRPVFAEKASYRGLATTGCWGCAVSARLSWAARYCCTMGVPRRQIASAYPVERIADRIALAANLPRFSTHTTRHRCLTDLARMGWELHAIATFAGHRSTDSTLQYIHLSRRDLSAKLNCSMAYPRVADRHAHRVRSRTARSGMNVVASAWTADRDSDQPSRRLGRDRRWDRRVALLDSEGAALLALGRHGLRRNRAVGVPRRT